MQNQEKLFDEIELISEQKGKIAKLKEKLAKEIEILKLMEK